MIAVIAIPCQGMNETTKNRISRFFVESLNIVFDQDERPFFLAGGP